MKRISDWLDKKTIYKILYYISFIPYIICIVVPITSYFSGATFMDTKITGIGAVELTLIVFLVYFCTIIPLIPISIIYQLIYNFKIKKNFNNKK